MDQRNSDNGLEGRLTFTGLDAAAMGRIASLQTHIKAHLPEALTRFYSLIARVPSVGHFFTDPKRVEHAKSRQLDHWGAIAAGRLDQNYFATANTVGQVHARIGLEPRWYIGGYGLIVETLVKGVVHDYISAKFPTGGGPFARKYSGKDVATATDEMSAAVTDMIKAVLLDVDIAVSTYFVKTTEETVQLNEEIGHVVGAAKDGDFSRRVGMTPTNRDLQALADSINGLVETVERGLSETGGVLAALAKADLTQRVTGEYRGAFAQLKTDANGVGDQLSEIVGRLRSTSRALKTATGEILAGANDLSERTTKQAATIEETSAAMEQLASTVVQNSKRAKDAEANSNQMTKAAEQSGEVMAQANTAMERISTSSSKISSIIGMIDDIAFQTNLLALNASVEAARAGDAGKGFAVVAVEVRRLAQSAASASSEVKTLIEQSGAEVAGGSKLVADASARLAQMLEAIKGNSALMQGIARDSGEQAASIEEVGQAVRQIDEMTQHNAALVEETNAAIEQTEAQAGELDRIVDVFVISDGESRAGRRQRAA
ncbi:MAG: methyl-accepting chemotaxis protein [Devosia sp.]